MISRGSESEPLHTAFTGLASDSIPVTVIEPSHGWVALRLGELWEYRDPPYVLTWREVRVHYDHTALGAARAKP
jgi:hypothetical protein